LETDRSGREGWGRRGERGRKGREGEGAGQGKWRRWGGIEEYDSTVRRKGSTVGGKGEENEYVDGTG
jgi:hypothetical protein